MSLAQTGDQTGPSGNARAFAQLKLQELNAKGYFPNKCNQNNPQLEPWEIPLPCNNSWNMPNPLLRPCFIAAPELRAAQLSRLQLYIHGLDGKTGGYYEGRIESLANPPAGPATFGGVACDLLGAAEGSTPDGTNMHGKPCGNGCKVSVERDNSGTVIDAWVDLTSCKRELSWIVGSWVRNLSSKWLAANDFYIKTAVAGGIQKNRGLPIPNYDQLGKGWACAPLVLDYLTDFQAIYETKLVNEGLTANDCVDNPQTSKQIAACEIKIAQKTFETMFVLVASCFQFEAAMADELNFLLAGGHSGQPVLQTIFNEPPIFCAPGSPCGTPFKDRYNANIVPVMKLLLSGDSAAPVYASPDKFPYFFPWSDTTIRGAKLSDLPIKAKE